MATATAAAAAAGASSMCTCYLPTTNKAALPPLLAPPLCNFKLQSLSISSITLLSHRVPRNRKGFTLYASISAAPPIPSPEVKSPPNPSDLVSSILFKVSETDRGVLLTREEHKVVDEIAQQLNKYCVDAPLKSPLIFGEWDVVYCSNPTSPGGGYRSALGRLIFKTNEMIQVLEAPDIVRNKVSFCALGFIDGQVSLKGKLTALDESWIQVVFEPPKLKLNVGGFEFQYGGESQVKLKITYIDEKIRLGKGSRGSLFVFQRRH